MKHILKKLEIDGKENLSALIRQFVKFGIVGTSNSLVYFVVYYGLLSLGVQYLIGNIFGAIISVVNAYYWNSRFVFKKDVSSSKVPFVKVVLAYGITFLLSTALLFLMVSVFMVPQCLAPLINLCIVIPLNFVLNKYWAFK